MVSPNFRNKVLRISVSDTKHLLSGPVSLVSEAWHLAFIWWSFGPLKFLQSCPQLHDTPLVVAEVLVDNNKRPCEAFSWDETRALIMLQGLRFKDMLQKDNQNNEVSTLNYTILSGEIRSKRWSTGGWRISFPDSSLEEASNIVYWRFYYNYPRQS